MGNGSVLFVLAHPDDESMGCGAAIARHHAAGVDVHLVCVTRGGAGWNGLPAGARPEQLPGIRARELERAAGVLGLASLTLWDHPDGAVDRCDQDDLGRRIAREIERLGPDAVVGWGPDGGYGHPDHIAVGACTDAAVARVAPGLPLYHIAADRRQADDYRRAFALAGAGADALPVRWRARCGVVVEPTTEELRIKAAAIACHESQLAPPLARVLASDDALLLLGRECYVRVGDRAGSTVLTNTIPAMSWS